MTRFPVPSTNKPPLLGVSKQFKNLTDLVEQHVRSQRNVLISGEAGTEKLSCVDYLTKDIAADDVGYFSPTLASSSQDKKILIIDPFELMPPQKSVIDVLKSARIIALSGISMVHLETGPQADLCRVLDFVEIKIPPLRERKEDILLYIDYYIQESCRQKRKKVPALSFQALIQMINYEWPGNLAELESVVHRTFLDPPDQIQEFEGVPRITMDPFPPLQPLADAVHWVEQQLITLALNHFNGNQGQAARALGISEPNLRYKMKKLQIRKKFIAE